MSLKYWCLFLGVRRPSLDGRLCDQAGFAYQVDDLFSSEDLQPARTLVMGAGVGLVDAQVRRGGCCRVERPLKRESDGTKAKSQSETVRRT